MRPNEKVERELSFWIDCLVEEIGNLYRCPACISDNSKVDRMAGDASLRDSLLEHLRQLIRLRMMCELYEDNGSGRSYLLEVSMSARGFSTRIR